MEDMGAMEDMEFIGFPHQYTIFGQPFLVRAKHFVLHNMPTIISDIEFELLGLCVPNEFVFTT